jgi:hypothetical protein
MLFPALGMATAVWLVMVPLLGLDAGLRAGLAVVVGVVGLILAPLGIWSRTSRRVVVIAGSLLAFTNFVLPGSTGAMANFAACGSLLVIAALAPQPVSVATTAVAIDASVGNEADTARLEVQERLSTAA